MCSNWRLKAARQYWFSSRLTYSLYLNVHSTDMPWMFGKDCWTTAMQKLHTNSKSVSDQGGFAREKSALRAYRKRFYRIICITVLWIRKQNLWTVLRLSFFCFHIKLLWNLFGNVAFLKKSEYIWKAIWETYRIGSATPILSHNTFEL